MRALYAPRAQESPINTLLLRRYALLSPAKSTGYIFLNRFSAINIPGSCVFSEHEQTGCMINLGIH